MNNEQNYYALQLSEHFTLGEFLRSGYAIKHGISNVPTLGDVYCMQQLCQNVLEPLRHNYGRVTITSGYRCKQLNEGVGGVMNSQHCLGEAADLYVSNLDAASKMRRLLESTPYDQLIMEPLHRTTRWVHVSYRPDGHNRHQRL